MGSSRVLEGRRDVDGDGVLSPARSGALCGLELLPRTCQCQCDLKLIDVCLCLRLAVSVAP
jgi:hypothetical protein